MNPMTRLALFALLVLAPVAAFAAPGDSPLDRMGDTGSILGSSASSASEAPTASRICNGVETGSTAPCPPPEAAAVPIDGGLSLLALAGIGFAARRLRSRRRANRA